MAERQTDDPLCKNQDDLRSVVARLEQEIVDMKIHVREVIAAHDARYGERHKALQKAIDAAIAGQKEAIAAALASADRAVSKAELASEKRFEGVNEFRAQLGDQQRTLMPRTEAENRLATLAERVGVLEDFRTETLSHGTGVRAGYVLAIGLVGLILTVLSIISVVMVLSRIGAP